MLASLVLRWNAFRGGADRAALDEARALTAELRATRELASQRVRLEVQQALENFEVAEASLGTAVEAHRSRLGRVRDHEPQTRPRPDQPGRVHRRAPRLHRCGAQRHPGARRIPRRAWPNSNLRSASPRRLDAGAICDESVRVWIVTRGRTRVDSCLRSTRRAARTGTRQSRRRPPCAPSRSRASRARTADPRGRHARAARRSATRVQGRRHRRDACCVDAGDVVQARPTAGGTEAAPRSRPSVAQATEAVEKARRDLERARRLRADEVATEEQVETWARRTTSRARICEAARFNASSRASRHRPTASSSSGWPRPANSCSQASPCSSSARPTPAGSCASGFADRDAVRVESATRPHVMFDAFPGRVFAGRITRVGAAADRPTGTFEVEIEVQPSGARFARGLVAKVGARPRGAARRGGDATRRPGVRTGRSGRPAGDRLCDRSRGTTSRAASEVTLGPDASASRSSSRPGSTSANRSSPTAPRG